MLRRVRRALSRLAGRGRRRNGGVSTYDVPTAAEDIEAYWTDERIRGARPREQRLDPPDRPG